MEAMEPTLSEQTRQLVRASVPALQKHSVAISATMYRLLFERYPETRSLFELPERQIHKLASALLAYARSIDNPSALQAAIRRMVLSHARAGVQAVHYPLVWECLRDAIKEVLGPDATETLLQAWKEAYDFLAHLLSTKEAQVYAVLAE